MERDAPPWLDCKCWLAERVDMQINGREITNLLPPYVVAEISGNHGGSIDNALKLIDAAKDTGAYAAKLQCFQPEMLTLDCDKPDFILKDGPWKGRRLYDLYKATETPRAWFPRLFEHAREMGFTLFSSVFAPEDVDFLETLACPAYKIASMEITDTNLIAHAAKTGKPLIISTGMASQDEIRNALEVMSSHKCKYRFLQCVSGYPTPIHEANLSEFNIFNHQGVSDHTIGCEIPIAATVLGAVIIEKHLALFDVDTEDSDFSMRPDEFAEMCMKVRQIWHAMQPSVRKSEESSRQLRRSLYAVADIKAGERFTNENVRSIRPAYGLPPNQLSKVLRCRAAHDIERGTALTTEMLSWQT